MFFDIENFEESSSTECSVLALNTLCCKQDHNSWNSTRSSASRFNGTPSSLNDYTSSVWNSACVQALKQSFETLKSLDYLDLEQLQYTNRKRYVNTGESLRIQMHRAVVSLGYFPVWMYKDASFNSFREENVTGFGSFAHERVLLPRCRSGKLSVTFGQDIFNSVNNCSSTAEKITALLPTIQMLHAITEDMNDLKWNLLRILCFKNSEDSALILKVLNSLTQGSLWAFCVNSPVPETELTDVLDLLFHHICKLASGPQDLLFHLQGLTNWNHHVIVRKRHILQVLLKYGLLYWLRKDNYRWNIPALNALNFTPFPDVLRMYFRTIPCAYLTYANFTDILHVDKLEDFQVEELKKRFQLYRRIVAPHEDANQRTPRSLKHYSRCKVREIMALNVQLPRGIEQLDIPQTLKEYLELKC